MAEKEGTQYASTGREESFREQGELRALHNFSTAIPKYAFQAKDMSQSEKLRLEKECEILKEFVRKIMKYGGDNYHQIIKEGDLTSLQQRVQEILKPSDGTTQRLNISGARFNAQKDTATDQSYSHVSNQPNKLEHLGARPKDRPPETDRYPKPSLLNSLKDGVPKKDTEPVAHGVAKTVSCERVASEGEEIEDFDQDIKRKEHEIRAEIEREKREREAWELEQPSAWPPQQEPVTMAEKEGTQYASTGREESFKEQGELRTLHNFSTAIPKYAFQAKDMSQSEKLRLEKECEILKEIVRKIMKYGGDNYHQIIKEGDLTSLQQRVQEILKPSVGTTQRLNISGARFNAQKDTATDQSDSHVSNQPKAHGVAKTVSCERVASEGEEIEDFDQDIKRKEHEIRAEIEREKREREAWELEQPSAWPPQQEPVTVQSLLPCEHYQRHCRVRFPCCNKWYSCHHCHNKSKECNNKEARASHATHLKCSYCHDEQEIGEDSAKCRRCGREMSAYFCAVCKHFMSIIKNPYHCEKCGICRQNKDALFHCDVCNVCFNKNYQRKHECRPNSGHDECGICLEDVFFRGFVILPCSHKVHHDCAEIMIQRRFDTCPVCRDPYRERLLSRNPFCSIL